MWFEYIFQCQKGNFSWIFFYHWLLLSEVGMLSDKKKMILTCFHLAGNMYPSFCLVYCGRIHGRQSEGLTNCLIKWWLQFALLYWLVFVSLTPLQFEAFLLMQGKISTVGKVQPALQPAAWVEILAWRLLRCVTMSRSLNLYLSQFPQPFAIRLRYAQHIVSAI